MIHRQPKRRRAPWVGPLLAACLTSLAVPAAGGDTRIGHLALDPHHTVVAFHLGGRLHDVHGTFALRTGALAVDPESGVTSGSVVVDATIGESGNASRDARMASAVLAGERFPEIRFRAEQADGRPQDDGTFHGVLHGVLTLRGDDHAITVAVEGRIAGDVVTARGHFSVPYVAWGLPDPSILLLTVAKTVDIDVTTEGHVTWTHQ